MLNLELFIHSVGWIAPEAAPGVAVLRLTAREPDYSGLIPPMQLRRMSKAVRMGIGASTTCLDGAGIQRPDAIAVGTALGCLQDTEVFLKKLVFQEERMLTPTSFIQSTHNTVAGQIALFTRCHGYNTTVSQHGHSFEGAVLAAALYLSEEPDNTVLCGAVDELTDTSFTLHQRSGVYTNAASSPEELLQRGGSGATAGEGAGFLLLSRQAEGAKARIAGLELLTEVDSADLLEKLQSALASAASADVLLLGDSGDARQRKVYGPLQQDWNGPVRFFKEQIGEWGTAIAPGICRAVKEWPGDTARVWVLNHYGRDWSVWLLEK